MEKNQLKTLKTLKESFFMYEKTKKECFERMHEAMNDDGSKRWTNEEIQEKVNNIQAMQDDVKEKYLYAGGNPEDLITQPQTSKTNAKKDVLKKDTPKKTATKPSIKKMKTKEEVRDNKPEIMVTSKTKEHTPVVPEYKEVSVVPSNWSSLDFKESFDVIPLPSKGECYEGNMSTIPVAYLTAHDENMIVAPNLYRDGLILDYLLKAKIKNTEIDPDDLLEGDREAIILWLRATGYGTEYPISVTDSKTGVEFETTIDLSQIKHKPFVLKGDENGHFDFTMPVTKDNIKFRFLTHGDIRQINEIEKEEQANVKKERLTNMVKELNTYLENETLLTKDEKLKLYEAKRNINNWIDKIEVDNDMGYTNKLTNRLELSIVSVNGEDDRDFISSYVENMNVRDALALRRYITENEPGLDYTITVERPKSLGGGSMPVFLSLDEYVFLNIV